MATIKQRLSSWALEELRWATQVNDSVLLAWYNKWLLIFQKMMLEFVSWQQNTAHVFRDIDKDVDEYELPLWAASTPDFYSIIQLRVAYKTDKLWNPIYRICKPINFSDYNIKPMLNQYDNNNELVEQWWRQVWWPYIWDRISMLSPRYVFINKDHIKIFPTPIEDVTNWLTLAYNYIEQQITVDQMNWYTYVDPDSWQTITVPPFDESDLNLPRYFFDAIEDYMTFRLYQAENPEMAQWYYQQFENTLHDNIYGLNKDKRPIEESFADTRYFSHY